MPIPARALSIASLAILSACLPRNEYSYRYFTGYSVTDSTNAYLMPDPSHPGDTLRDTSRFLNMYEADSLLFRYRYEHHSSPGIADGYYYETLLFVLPTNVGNFRIDSTHPGKVYFQDGCFGFCGLQTVVSSDIEGNPHGSGKYRVRGTVIYDRIAYFERDSVNHAYSRDTLRFEGTFSKASGAPD